MSSNLSNVASVLFHENCTEFEGLIDNYEYVCGLSKCAVEVCANFNK